MKKEDKKVVIWFVIMFFAIILDIVIFDDEFIFSIIFFWGSIIVGNLIPKELTDDENAIRLGLEFEANQEAEIRGRKYKKWFNGGFEKKRKDY